MIQKLNKVNEKLVVNAVKIFRLFIRSNSHNSSRARSVEIKKTRFRCFVGNLFGKRAQSAFFILSALVLMFMIFAAASL